MFVEINIIVIIYLLIIERTFNKSVSLGLIALIILIFGGIYMFEDRAIYIPSKICQYIAIPLAAQYSKDNHYGFRHPSEM